MRTARGQNSCGAEGALPGTRRGTVGQRERAVRKMKKNDDESFEHTVAPRMGWWSRNQNGEKIVAVAISVVLSVMFIMRPLGADDAPDLVGVAPEIATRACWVVPCPGSNGTCTQGVRNFVS